MALNRSDSCRHFKDNNGFIKCLCYYSASYSGKTNGWEIVVMRADLPAGQQAAPTNAQVQAVADPKATTLYNAWKTSVDAEVASGLGETSMSGQAGQVAA